MSYGASMISVTFVASATGTWRIDRITPVRGETLAHATHLTMHEGPPPASAQAWALRGVTSHARYVERAEKIQLDAVSPPLGRAEATRAVLIPIRKSAAWWALPQDERRTIFETRSHHIAASLRYLPAVARRLHHGRELGEPFDFLTWFELAPQHEAAFDELTAMLRETEEWSYVEREVEVRVTRL